MVNSPYRWLNKQINYLNSLVNEMYLVRHGIMLRCITVKDNPGSLSPPDAVSTRAEILVGIQLDSDWDYLLQLGI